jgi:hypothetical protein
MIGQGHNPIKPHAPAASAPQASFTAQSPGFQQPYPAHHSPPPPQPYYAPQPPMAYQPQHPVAYAPAPAYAQQPMLSSTLRLPLPVGCMQHHLVPRCQPQAGDHADACPSFGCGVPVRAPSADWVVLFVLQH